MASNRQQKISIERRRWRRDLPDNRSPLNSGTPISKPLKFSTSDLPATEQFNAWKAYLNDLYDVRLPDGSRADEGFPAEHVTWNLGNALLTVEHAPAFSFERSEQRLRLNSLDLWQINILLEGKSWVGTETSLAENIPGLVEFRSLSAAFSGRRLASKLITLYLPSDIFADIGGIPLGLNNRAISSNIATLLYDYIKSLEASLPQLTTEDLIPITKQIRQLVLDCLQPYLKREHDKSLAQHIGLMEKARQYINMNIAQDDLNADFLSQYLAISRTKLYQLFEPHGGVLSYIRKRRLAAAHRALNDKSNNDRIGDIALAMGFDSAANFSRAFTQEFGYSPRDARQERTVTKKSANSQTSAPQEKTFHKLLIELGSGST